MRGGLGTGRERETQEFSFAAHVSSCVIAFFPLDDDEDDIVFFSLVVSKRLIRCLEEFHLRVHSRFLPDRHLCARYILRGAVSSSCCV